jgi:hypothetical protein
MTDSDSDTDSDPGARMEIRDKNLRENDRQKLFSGI